VLIDMSHRRVENVLKRPEREPLPNAGALAGWAAVLGHARADDEDDVSYAKRVFHLSDVAPPRTASK
jgi:hypothetical protein